MTDKEVIEYWKKELYQYEYTKDLDLASDNYFGQFEEKINMIGGVLNLIQTQQEEIENLKYRKERQLKRFSKYKENIENKHEEIYEDFVDEIEKKDKIIDLILEKQAGSSCLNIYCKKRNKKDKCLECVKEYFINKVEKESKDE